MEKNTPENKPETDRETEPKKEQKRKPSDNIFIIFLIAALLMFGGGALGEGLVALLKLALPESIKEGAVFKTAGMYISVAMICFTVIGYLLLNKKDRPILKHLMHAPKGNTFKMALCGLAVGFATNGLCILVSWLMGDIALHYDGIDIAGTILIFVLVLLQSSAEELSCRLYVYRAVKRTYNRPWIYIFGNALFFAVLHLGNDGLTFFGVTALVLIGIFLSFIVYYTDSLWWTFTFHAAWNFTQNILFGLPNSGNVVPYSIFKLDAGSGKTGFAYHVNFGVEGSIMANLLILLGIVGIWLWGRKRRPPIFGKETPEEGKEAV